MGRPFAFRGMFSFCSLGYVIMLTAFKGGRHIVLLRLASALALASGLTLRHPLLDFLAHLWCAYAMALCLSWIVRREVSCVCVKHNYPKM